MNWDIVCAGMALVDSIIRGFDPEPVSASGFRAVSGTLNAGGEAVNEAMAAAKLGCRTAILCALGEDGAGGHGQSRPAQGGGLHGSDCPKPRDARDNPVCAGGRLEKVHYQ